MKKYFCFSDCHGFYDELMKALNKADFDINNPEHIIIVCGDIFDRGKQPIEIYEFLKSIPKERRILIRGNHELLLRDLVKRGYADTHDYHNGTLDTLYAIAGLESELDFMSKFYKEMYDNKIEYGTDEWQILRSNYNSERMKIWRGKVKEILDWIFSDEWINFYETNNYIFVHSFIPIGQQQIYECMHYEPVGESYYREDWRNATSAEWEDAMWGCPWRKAKEGLNQTGKTIVCGHWHTSDFYNNLTRQKKKDVFDCPIFKSNKYKIIGLDACTAGSYKVNVLVLNEDEL